eukprot:1156047-Pelagomonas_calceolata.AAC.6
MHSSKLHEPTAYTMPPKRGSACKHSGPKHIVMCIFCPLQDAVRGANFMSAITDFQINGKTFYVSVHGGRPCAA